MTARRRLAAILMADVAGFTRLMASDEEGTASRIVEMHGQVRAAVEDHGGRVVSTAGDSFFGLFDSVVEAFECGRRMQEEAAKAQETLPPQERIALRIGLHLGDVIQEGDDVLGEGVNIASRLEEMSEPGGMAVSGAVHEQVGSRVELRFEDRGDRSMRGIGRSVRVHTLSAEALGGEGAHPAASKTDDVDSAREEMRRAADVLRREMRTRVDERRAARDQLARRRSQRPKRGLLAALLGVGNLTVLAVGLLIAVPQLADGTPSGLWMLVGGALVGLAAGMIVTDATGSRGWSAIGIALGAAVGAWWLGSAVLRAATWVVAAGMLGAGIEALRRGRSAHS
jgi:class 3 adenylate cyclase